MIMSPVCVQGVKPKDFAMQINLSMENCWGIVRALVDVVAAMDDGKYLLVKCAAWPTRYRMCIARNSKHNETHTCGPAPHEIHPAMTPSCIALRTKTIS